MTGGQKKVRGLKPKGSGGLKREGLGRVRKKGLHGFKKAVGKKQTNKNKQTNKQTNKHGGLKQGGPEMLPR